MARILVVDDEKTLLKLAKMCFGKAGHDVQLCSSGREAIELLEKTAGPRLEYDVVLTDYRLNDVTGVDVLRAAKRLDESVQVLLMTAYATTQLAVEVMRYGAYDVIEKPFKWDVLLSLIEKAIARRVTMTGETEPVESKEQVSNFVGKSPEMQAIMELVRRVAPTRANILITGESGTGKEVIARAVHQLSGMSGPIISVNCGAIPESLVESEFFGYVKGAFTGAVKDREGFFQAARGGSLFLDEIGELPLSMQVKLLRAIQEKKIQPVGSQREEPVSVRIIAATNRDLRSEVEAHRFREDLFFRLNVIQLSLPALRERRDDLPVLIHHFIQKFNRELGKSIVGVSPEALDILMRYEYRGNVRELENILEHATTLETSSNITVNVLPAYLKHRYIDGMSSGEEEKVSRPAREDVGLPYQSSDSLHRIDDEVDGSERLNDKFDRELIEQSLEKLDASDGVELDSIVEDLERHLIERSLEKTNGNKTEAARLLGITFRSLRYRLKKYGYE